MVKKFIRNPSEIKRKQPLTEIPVTGSKGITQKGSTIRLNNRKVPLNPQGSRNKPRSGTFATRQKKGGVR